MARKHDCDCERGGSFPVFGEGFSRRQFLQVAGTLPAGTDAEHRESAR